MSIERFLVGAPCASSSFICTANTLNSWRMHRYITHTCAQCLDSSRILMAILIRNQCMGQAIFKSEECKNDKNNGWTREWHIRTVSFFRSNSLIRRFCMFHHMNSEGFSRTRFFWHQLSLQIIECRLNSQFIRDLSTYFLYKWMQRPTIETRIYQKCFAKLFQRLFFTSALLFGCHCSNSIPVFST